MTLALAENVDIDSVADELYGLPLEQFVQVRTARERDARAAGDRALAAQIRRLPKPSLVAWTANQLVRQQWDEIEPLLALGAQVREAAAGLSADDLRGLSRQQHQIIRAVVRQAAELSRAEGRGFSDSTERGLQDTLHAALVDPEVADALTAGRLTEAAQRSGLEALSPSAAAPARPADRKGRAASPQDRTGRGRTAKGGRAERDRADELGRARRRRAERGLEQARAARADADADREAAGKRLAQAEADVAAADRDVSRLRAELDAAVEAHERAEADRQQAQADVAAAEDAVATAATRQADAEAELAELT